MEKREILWKENNSSTKIKWIIAALLLALWSSSFSYSQENLSERNQYNVVDLKAFQDFKEKELVREANLKRRNLIYQILWKLITDDNRHGFPEFNEIDEELQKILDEMTKDEFYISNLNQFLVDLNNLYLREKNIECRMAISHMKSRISDEKIRFLDWINEPYELLKRQLKVWDIILLNKKNSPFDIWTKALKIYDEKYLTDFTHVLIFIWFDENWDILVRHSTTATEKFHKIGVENTTLNSYIFDKDRSNAEWYDIVVLRPDPTIVQSILKLSEEKLESWYDNLSALRQWFGLPNTFNDRYNCVELVTQSIFFDESQMVHFDDSWDYSFSWKLNKELEKLYAECLKIDVQDLRSKTFPDDLLDSSLFKEVYSSTISK